MNYYYPSIFLILIVINKSIQSDDSEFLDLKQKNSSICDLKISTDNLIIFEKCILSDEWKLFMKKTSSQNALEVYEKEDTNRRIFNFDYIIDNHKSQQDIIINNITIKTYYQKTYINNINISIANNFPIFLKKGDNFDVIVEYFDYDLLYIDVILTVNIQNNLNGKDIELNISYKKIISNDYNKKINLSYFFLVIFFILFIFLIRLKFLIEENQFIRIHINEIMQGKNAEKIFVVIGIVLTILLFFMIIKYIYYITFIFSILLAILSVKSFFKYLFKIILPSFTNFLDNKFLEIKVYKIEYSNIVFYPMSILVIVFWYNLSDENYLFLHTFLNDIIFFTIVYFNVHKLNLKNFYIITAISFIVIIYQVIKMVVEENNIQEDENIFYITTRFIIDVPIRFILKDFVDSPFEEIYFFSILDIILIGFILHYCENTFHLSKIYMMISIYGTIIGLIINMILFYGLRLSPPMSTVPLFINIIALIGYSVYQKQFKDFMDIEINEKNDNEEFKEIQEIEEDQNAQMEVFKMSEDNNISFKISNEEDKDRDTIRLKETDKEDIEEDSDSEEKERKEHENLINNLNKKLSTKKINYSNKINTISLAQQDDSDNEGIENFLDLVRGISERKIGSPYFSPETGKINENKNKNNLKINGKQRIEMKIIEDEKENKKNKENKDKKDNKKEKEENKDNDKEKEKEKNN